MDNNLTIMLLNKIRAIQTLLEKIKLHKIQILQQVTPIKLQFNPPVEVAAVRLWLQEPFQLQFRNLKLNRLSRHMQS